MGDWKPPMALIFNSYSYDGIGQTSPSMFAQHHQLPCFVKLSIRSSSNQIRYYLTNSSLVCQVFFELGSNPSAAVKILVSIFFGPNKGGPLSKL